jgi:hypothetical protein
MVIEARKVKACWFGGSAKNGFGPAILEPKPLPFCTVC